jgi:hypothetical protein
MSNKVEGMTMNQDDEKLYFYINMSWFLLWRLSVLSGPVWNVLSMGGAFAIAFVWAIIRKRRAANKE